MPFNGPAATFSQRLALYRIRAWCSDSPTADFITDNNTHGNVLRALERQGLIVRDPNDLRRVQITDAGHRALPQHYTRWNLKE